MPDKNIAVWESDVVNAATFTTSLILSWPEQDWSVLPDLTPLILSDVAWARVRRAMGLTADPDKPAAVARRHQINEALYHLFKDSQIMPQMIYLPGDPIPTIQVIATVEAALTYEAADDQGTTTIGRPRLYTGAEIARMMEGASAAERRRLARLKPCDAPDGLTT